MKKLFFAAALAAMFALSAQIQTQAQTQNFSFKRFRVDAGLGAIIPLPKDLNGVILTYFEPKYELIPQIAVGFRCEGSMFGGPSSWAIATRASLEYSFKINSSYMLTGDYYFDNNFFRPFAGLGLGVFTQERCSCSGSSTPVTFATMLRAGFDIYHFRFTLSYNRDFNNHNPLYGDKDFNFLSLTAGFYIGGGRK